MKKILFIMFSVMMLLTNSFSQSIMRTQNSNTYDGTTATIAANRSLSFTGVLSYYSTGAGAGDTSTYKLGADSSTVITPAGRKPFSTFPSPTNGPLQINFDEPVQQVKFSIYNMIGNEIKNVPIEKINDQQFKFNFRNQQPGFYFIRIQTGKYTYTTRVTITTAVSQKGPAISA